MIKQVTVTDLQRRAAEVIGGLKEGPVVVSQRGRPAAVIVTAEAYEQMERALANVLENSSRYAGSEPVSVRAHLAGRQLALLVLGPFAHCLISIGCGCWAACGCSGPA